ncbi:hypothetical protein AGMMS50225_28680 [Betaproteobacteria bacterium]|nr:hypothetical protein AGMMS50225_28680 [Betaproteobacteria bacterium]
MLAGLEINFYYPHPAWTILELSGLIIILIFMCLNSDPDENKYGAKAYDVLGATASRRRTMARTPSLPDPSESVTAGFQTRPPLQP